MTKWRNAVLVLLAVMATKWFFSYLHEKPWDFADALFLGLACAVGSLLGDIVWSKRRAQLIKKFGDVDV